MEGGRKSSRERERGTVMERQRDLLILGGKGGALLNITPSLHP